jgi:hypothetical protein
MKACTSKWLKPSNTVPFNSSLNNIYGMPYILAPLLAIFRGYIFVRTSMKVLASHNCNTINILPWFSELVTASTGYVITVLQTSQITIGHTRSCESVSLRQQLLGNSFQQQTFPFLWLPELSLASATSFSQQQFTTPEPQSLSNLQTNRLTGSALTCPAYNISARTTQKTPLLCCSAIAAVETCLFVEPLLSNTCCIVGYFEVVA